MEISEVLARGHDAVTVKRVFGDPIEKDGLTVIPAATVGGGGGGGGGEGPEGQGGKGSGAGYGFGARPVGAFVIKDGEVRWQPAFDLNRLVLLGVVALLTFRSIAKTRARARARTRRAKARLS
jgi:uncharacterized spore protein YtfJ